MANSINIAYYMYSFNKHITVAMDEFDVTDGIIYWNSTDRTRLSFVSAAVVGAGTAVFLVWWWWSRRQKDRLPTKWRKVGELSDLICFPVKSLGPARMNELECTQLGLKHGWMRDRILMVIDLDGQFVSGRQYPKMVQVNPLC